MSPWSSRIKKQTKKQTKSKSHIQFGYFLLLNSFFWWLDSSFSWACVFCTVTASEPCCWGQKDVSQDPVTLQRTQWTEDGRSERTEGNPSSSKTKWKNDGGGGEDRGISEGQQAGCCQVTTFKALGNLLFPGSTPYAFPYVPVWIELKRVCVYVKKDMSLSNLSKRQMSSFHRKYLKWNKVSPPINPHHLIYHTFSALQPVNSYILKTERAV